MVEPAAHSAACLSIMLMSFKLTFRCFSLGGVCVCVFWRQTILNVIVATTWACTKSDTKLEEKQILIMLGALSSYHIRILSLDKMYHLYHCTVLSDITVVMEWIEISDSSSCGYLDYTCGD